MGTQNMLDDLRDLGFHYAWYAKNIRRCAQHSAWYRINMAYGVHSDAENDRRDVMRYCGPILRDTRGYSTSALNHMSASAGIASLTWDVSPNIATENIAEH